MKALGRLVKLAVLLLALSIVPVATAGTSIRKAEATAKPEVREYLIYVLTTESRIPKRYIVRIRSTGQLTTGQPVTIYFNNNRLKLIDADLIVARHGGF